MRAETLPLLLTISLLLSCNGDTGASDSEGQKTTENEAHLSFAIVELKRKGGNRCPADTEEPADTTGEDYLCASVKLTYPQVSSDANPELAAKINATILRQLVDSEESAGDVDEQLSLEQFADNFIADYQEDPNQFTSWELERTINIAHLTDKLLTLLFGEYGYTGGAHPFSGQRYSVLSLEDASPIVLADLLNPGYEPPLNVIGEKAFRNIRELGEGDSLEEQGFSFENNVFNLNENFGVIDEGLEFIFNSYEVAPYAMGPTQFTIPYEDVYSLIDPDSFLSESIQ